jgi:hypothetical protein
LRSLSSAWPSSPKREASDARLAEGHGRDRDQDRGLRARPGDDGAALQGGRLVARNINPPTHTRLPRYIRGKHGVVQHNHGGFAFADTRAHGLGDQPHHVYSVRFEARELWGDDAAPRDAVYIDLWEPYIEPAA